MIRTRVGYTGGDKPNPTYRDLGNHSEAVQIDFDPAKITYKDLLDVFWESHDPASGPWSRQYMAAVFYHDDAQRKTAESAREQIAANITGEVKTQLLQLKTFYLAEDYHQKYALRRYRNFMAEFKAFYPETKALIDSTAAARVNGYLDGFGECNQLKEEIHALGLSPEARKHLLDIVCGR